eukprot:11103883-Ditylum_brightwellii.AAC.1
MDAERCTKKRNLNAKEIKDLCAFFNDKVNEMLKEHSNGVQTMSNFIICQSPQATRASRAL